MPTLPTIVLCCHLLLVWSHIALEAAWLTGTRNAAPANRNPLHAVSCQA